MSIMKAISTFVRVSLPEYFRSLPIPETFVGFLRLSGSDWLRIIPTAGAIGLVVYLAVSKFQGSGKQKDGLVNLSIKKDQEKVVDSFDMEDLGDSAVFCRCWRSKKFPFCDGSHVTHNKETGDNVGPLCLSRKSGSS